MQHLPRRQPASPLLALINTAQKAQQWTNTYRTTVRTTRPSPSCVSFTQRPVRPIPAVFPSYTQPQLLMSHVRPALKQPQATIYLNHIPQTHPSPPLPIFAVMYVSRPARKKRRKAWDVMCCTETCVCVCVHRPAALSRNAFALGLASRSKGARKLVLRGWRSVLSGQLIVI